MLLCDVRYVLAVPEHRNFTYAAEALHVSQPTLSQRIRQLEDTLRTQRLDRSGRNVQFMDAGAAWMRYAKSVLRDLDAGGRRQSRYPPGHSAVGLRKNKRCPKINGDCGGSTSEDRFMANKSHWRECRHGTQFLSESAVNQGAGPEKAVFRRVDWLDKGAVNRSLEAWCRARRRDAPTMGQFLVCEFDEYATIRGR